MNEELVNELTAEVMAAARVIESEILSRVDTRNVDEDCIPLIRLATQAAMISVVVATTRGMSDESFEGYLTAMRKQRREDMTGVKNQVFR